MTNRDTDRVKVRTDDQLPSTTIIEAIAAVTNTELTDIPPLTDFVNPDAVDELFAGRDGGLLTFTYAGCQVRVINDTTVTVQPN